MTSLPSSNPIVLPDLPTQGEVVCWDGLYGAAKWIALAQAAENSKKPFVLVLPDVRSVEAVSHDLSFFSPNIQLFTFPDWETLPYDRFSPYQDIVSERLRILSTMSHLTDGIIITSIQTALHRLLPKDWLIKATFPLSCGHQIQRDAFRTRITESGYIATSQVSAPGEFAVRGSLMDVFPVGAESPIRIDLFDDEIDTLRVFDPETQRTTGELDSIDILPAREFPTDKQGISEFRRSWREYFSSEYQGSTIYQDVSEGLVPAGIEYYLPLFHAQTNVLADYIPPSSVVVFDESVETAAEKFKLSVEERYEALRHDISRPILPAEDIFTEFDELQNSFQTLARLNLSGTSTSDCSAKFNTVVPVNVPVDARSQDPFIAIKHHLSRTDGRLLFLADSLGRREALLDLFREQIFRPVIFDGWQEFLRADDRYGIAVASLESGAELVEPRLSVLTETQLFGRRTEQRRRRKKSSISHESIIRNLTELNANSPVVHENYGVGRYLGLEVLTIGDIQNEFIKIEYRDGDKLYIPVASLDLISRYTGSDPEHAPLHKLGTGQWEKARRKASEKIRDVAAELLEIHATRALRRGHSFTIDEDAYNSFVNGFPFEETTDQVNAVDEVLKDMQNPQPMDRLICGDVGFGKTEVALRAACVAVNDGFQVAILVPTTLLATQHHETFRDRFAELPVRVELLSRFRNIKQTREVIGALESGTVDIVIGTHKLLSKDIKFNRLGLLVVDEEHRFGVVQKEKMKSLRVDVDILTLTATPIPRTLNLALSGTRELSIIATPPLKRLAVKTYVREWSKALVREAILREIGRGGQVYYVHNQVESIEKEMKKLERMVPEARIAIAHGQMREQQLEQVMLDFSHGRTNVLVCSTIIETGLDIPNANTMLINRADKFGLAQLYQLRGRVGRSHHRAYAYLIAPHPKVISRDAAKRLEVMESLEELGMGFTLATHDLEIRGAGEILGDEQSGHIQEIGFGLYSDLLMRAIEALKSGRQSSISDASEVGVEVNLSIPTLFPENYLPDVHSRLVLYKRIAGAESTAELEELKSEIIDRLGMFEQPVANLFSVASLKLRARNLGMKRMDFGSKGGKVEFYNHCSVSPEQVISLITEHTSYRLDGSEKLRLSKALPDSISRISEADFLLQFLEDGLVS
jgi:transcription-repair coupling factor (superfamily II helicase)